jgi:D-amino-acid dehydrogenase
MATINEPRGSEVMVGAMLLGPSDSKCTAGDFENVTPCGPRPCSPDGLPYLGRTRRFRNLCIATGHAMMDLSLGPISGKLIAELLSGESPCIDLRLLNPDRYA